MAVKSTQRKGQPVVTREQLHRLVEELPDEELQAAGRFLGYLLDLRPDPMLLALAMAPIDDEPETPEEAEAVREAKEDLAAGRVHTQEEVRRMLEGK